MLKRIILIVLIFSVIAFLPKSSCQKKDSIKVEDQAEDRLKSDKDKRKTGCIEGDCIDGYGTYVYDDGSAYTGTFKDGKKHGKGTMTWTSGPRKGEKYEG
ncbi:MAG: hypothetical protein JXN64_13110, partial [Spirochaetes bacterium]|nr:hypothetical protein [Spirochaetota bacterium]